MTCVRLLLLFIKLIGVTFLFSVNLLVTAECQVYALQKFPLFQTERLKREWLQFQSNFYLSEKIGKLKATSCQVK